MVLLMETANVCLTTANEMTKDSTTPLAAFHLESLHRLISLIGPEGES
jgi:hypothetical protein